MSKREPELDLLLRGDLLALSPLKYAELRSRMLEALRDRLPAYTQRQANDPGVSIVEALAACLEVMGFYHDRILTESRLGSALLLESVARLGEVVGYRPAPPLAAVARQFFLAAAEGQIPAGTRVAGKGGDPPVNVVFETTVAIPISPAFNRMALSPLITRYAAAVRAVIALLTTRAGLDALPSLADIAAQQDALAASLPLDDFRAGMTAMVNGPHGLELCEIATSRRRGVAFVRPLLRSYDERTTMLSRATRIRHLRFWRPLGDFPDGDLPRDGEGPEQVIFEVTDRPILHMPDPAAPEILRSTLQVFVFDAPGDIGDPSTWDPRAAWTEVPDFSASEASDHHYRTLVDDRLHTHIVLRRRLGFRTLLDAAALSRVYVRFTPAVGRVAAALPKAPGKVDLPQTLPGKPIDPPVEAADLFQLDGVTMRLYDDYFQSALVRPTLTGVTLDNKAGWAVTKDAIDLAAGDQIALLGGASGQMFFRTLTLVRGRSLRWTPHVPQPGDAEPAGPTLTESGPFPAQLHDPIDDVFDPAKATVAPLEDASRGQGYPLLEPFYKQAHDPDTVGRKLPKTEVLPSNIITDLVKKSGVGIRQYLHAAKGSNFILLQDASHVRSGDFLLIGRRLRASYRDKPTPNKLPKDGFDPRAPWLTAEVVQAVEVQGNLVRIKDPIGQDYYRDRHDTRDDKDAPNGPWLTDIIVVPSVASVYYGDLFAQEVTLNNERTFIAAGPAVDSFYIRVALDSILNGRGLRETLGWQPLHDAGKLVDMYNRLFLAVAGQVIEPSTVSWSYSVIVPTRDLRAQHLSGLELSAATPSPGKSLTSAPLSVEGTSSFRIRLASAPAATDAHNNPGEIIAVVDSASGDFEWKTLVDESVPLAAGAYRIVADAGQYFLPPAGTDKLDDRLLAKGGTLLFDWSPTGEHTELAFTWPREGGQPSIRGLLLTGVVDVPSGAVSVNARAIATAGALKIDGATPDVSSWSADWSLPTHFTRTTWLPFASSGSLVLDGSSYTNLSFFQTLGKFELHNLAFVPAQKLNPLAGVTRLWALPTAQTLSIASSDLEAIWLFPIDDSTADKLKTPQPWEGLLAVERQNQQLLSLASLDTTSGNFLHLELIGDTRDLSGPPSKLFALDQPVLSNPSHQEIWVYSAAVSDVSNDSKRAALAVVPVGGGAPVVQRATFFFEPSLKRLWLRPDTALSETPTEARGVKQIVQLFESAALNVKATPAGTDPNKTTVVTFTVPDGWPGKAGNNLVAPGKVILCKHKDDKLEELQTADTVSVDSNAKTGTLVFKSDISKLFEGFSDVFLTLNDWSAAGSTVTQTRALSAAQSPWGARQALDLFFMPAFETISSIVLPDSGKVLFVPAKPTDAFPSTLTDVRRSLVGFVGDAAKPLAPTGRTRVHVPVGSVSALGISDDAFTALGFLVFMKDNPWVERPIVPGKIQLSKFKTEWNLELEDALSKIFSGAIPQDVPLSVVYDVANRLPNELCTGLRLRGQIPVSKLNELGILDAGSKANTVVFHTGSDFGSALIRSFKKVSPTGTIEMSVDASVVFNGTSEPRFPSLSFAESWDKLSTASVSVQNLLVALGPAPFAASMPAGQALALQPGDELTLFDGQNLATRAAIKRVSSSGAYELDHSVPIARIRLRGVKVTVTAFSADLTLRSPSDQSPWLLTTTKARTTTELAKPIADTLLRYDAHTPNTDGTQSFRFDDAGAVKTIFDNPNQPIFLYANQKAELRDDLYLSKTVKALDKENFLKTDEDVTALLVKRTSTVFPPGGGGVQPSPSVFIASTDWKPIPGDTTVDGAGRGTKERTLERIQIGVVSQSIVFNSGNFIPVTGANPGGDDAIIRNALRVRVALAGQTAHVTYDRTLSDIVEKIEKGTFVFDDAEGAKYLYSFNKVPGGAFTLNFLMIGDQFDDEIKVTVYVEYGADQLSPAADGTGEQSEEAKNRLYEFETSVEVVQPATQLVVLDTGPLKADDYLFLHTAADQTVTNPAEPSAPPPIQWTRVVSVAGPIIQVAPPLTYDLASFYRYALAGFSRPPKPVPLDKDYYAWLKDAVFTPAEGAPKAMQSFDVPLADRLALDPFAHAVLLSALIPGDLLLIWDEDIRKAWHKHRLNPADAGAEKWPQWPSYVHEAVVKQVDADTGLLVLSEPLPDRFCARYTWNPDPAPRELGARLPRLRILPHYRAPFQGARRLSVLGSGDKSRRFARYIGTLDPDPGLATLPLPPEGVYAGNIEVLSRDPRSGEWSRWTQFADIDKAEKKDRAFMLGVDLAAVGSGAPGFVPFSVSFGDGRTGQLLPTGIRNVFARVASIGGFEPHVDRRRPLRILAVWSGPAPFPVPPDAAAAPVNLWLRIESSAAEAWCQNQPGARDPAPLAADKGAWRSSMRVETIDDLHALTAWREVDECEARAGCDGIFVRGVRPGIVDVFFFARHPITSGAVQAWEVPDARLWVLDAGFYDGMMKSDPSRAAGATRMGLLETRGIAAGSLLAFSRDAASPVEMAEVATVDDDTWSVELSQGLAQTYPLATAFLRGNIVDVVQGNTESLTLGSGDGSSRNLRLAVNNRAPLLHAMTAGQTDPSPCITVLVDGAAWARVDDFDGSRPRDRVYRLDIETSGAAFVAFGDGVHGAVPPAGTNNITAAIRTGDGEAGNLPAGAIDKLRDGILARNGVVAVKATSNLTDAAGGRRAETADQARDTLLGRSVGFERVITADDAARVALEVGEVLHARLDPTAPAGEISLIVALEGRRTPTDAVRATIRDRIAARMPATAGVSLAVRGAEQVPVYLEIRISVSEGYRQADVLGAVGRTFSATTGGFFAAERWPVGEPLRLGDVYETLFALPGVAAAQVVWMSTEKLHDARPLADAVSPGPRGVVRCDSDPVSDPQQDRGSIQFVLEGGVR